MVEQNPSPRGEKKQIGMHYENVACQFLRGKGLILLEKNSQYPLGEIDLIMQDKSCFVFVEVRYRKNDHYGCAATTIDRHKQAKIIKAAYLWMDNKQIDAEQTEFRFDIIAITGKQTLWIMNAF